MPCLFQLIPFYRNFTMPCLYHFTEILRCLAYTMLQTFYNSSLTLFYRDLTMPCLYHFPAILQCPACTILQGLLLIPCEIYQENPGISQEFPRIIPRISMNILRFNLHQHSLEFSGLYWNRNRLKILGNS